MTGGASGIQASNSTNGKFQKPVEGKVISNFGYRNISTKGASKNHKGIDIRVPVGTPAKAIAGGTVTKAGASSGYGIAVFINHGTINGVNVKSELGHLSKCTVKVGDKVSAGQVVAKSGNTGVSQGPHLHVTIRENDIHVDPRKYLKY